MTLTVALADTTRGSPMRVEYSATTSTVDGEMVTDQFLSRSAMMEAEAYW